MIFSAGPAEQDLYDPAYEYDSCGMALLADLHGRRAHTIVSDALSALVNLRHRGAGGSDPATGDGAGILVQLPDELLRATAGRTLPGPDAAGRSRYAAGIAFLPADPARRSAAIALTERVAGAEGLEVLGWRELPVDADRAGLGEAARRVMPHFAVLLVACGAGQRAGIELDRLALCLRKRVERESVAAGCGTYFPSLSARTFVYKGMLTPAQLPEFFPDLSDPRLVSAIALVHSRFSSNTFPSWPRAHPFRFVAHNGEINTIRGNRDRMRAREALLSSDVIPGDLGRLFPVCDPDGSDSASFDEVLELLHLGGRSLPHSVLMMIPEAWENDDRMDPRLRAFYQFHNGIMEPWDGPACVAFTDGSLAGAMLDRNGLRPARWCRTADDRVLVASEAGVLETPPERVVATGRLRPGHMFLVDTEAGRILDDEDVKATLAERQPYADWLNSGLLRLDELPDRHHVVQPHASVIRRQQAFGYTEEEMRLVLAPMATSGTEPVGSMGTDTPVAVRSARSRLLYDYFAQSFAQVTHPPLDTAREGVVTSVARVLGPETNLLAPGPDSCRHIRLPYPVIDNDELAKLIHANQDGEFPGLSCRVLAGLYDVAGGGRSLSSALDSVCRQASEAIAAGARTLVLSDRDCDHRMAPIPSLLLVSAVHHHLVRTKERLRVALVAETGDAREVHHVALLLGYGAAAVNPYLAFESIEDLLHQSAITGMLPGSAIRNYVRALVDGVRTVMSKMGISTVGSYTAAQHFEAVGLSRHVLDRHFTGTRSVMDGVGMDALAAEVARRHRRAYPDNPAEREYQRLEAGGAYTYRRSGELHMFTPETVFYLQHASESGRERAYRQYSEEVRRLAAEGGTLRGLFRLHGDRDPVPLDEVEPVEAICSRFATAAMSYGAISAEAHETLAVAMNRIGGKSNSGEGGEDPSRLRGERRSAIKQVASGRFGVTSEYLVSADDIEIKMAQGAQPGEGGMLPSHKVYPWIARTRSTTAGVGLISPPQHHDVYSIEDLEQLIHDLKNANDRARVQVKLASQLGVGTVAAGVVKARADAVTISGHDGGTGAASLDALSHTGTPWEIGLAETQQTLLLNGLRDRITVRVDGGMRTGRDVVVAALLGAEEYAFATAPLVVSGCVLTRACHLDTCPVGIATQNPTLRQRYTGKAEHVVNYFRFVAGEVRQLLAQLGFRSLDEAIGRTGALVTDAAEESWTSHGLDLAPLFAKPRNPFGNTRRRVRGQDHGLRHALDRTVIQLAEAALEDPRPVHVELPVRNVNRSVGTLLGAEVTRRYGGAGLAEDTVRLTLTGSAGQSLGAFLPRGVRIDLYGEANDYVAKGLSGGRVVVRPHPSSGFVAEHQVIAGNAIGYGATGGEIFLRGQVGERFCVRNSGATAVAEGAGDHAMEYMTRGCAVVLGPCGRNLAAGMSGGLGYVLDLDPAWVNTETVELRVPEPAELDWLREVVRRHRMLTDSAVASGLLAAWRYRARSITKITPRDHAVTAQTADTHGDAGRQGEETRAGQRRIGEEASRG